MDPRHTPLPVDLARYTVQDAAGTIRALPPRWRHAVAGAEELPAGVAVALEALGDALEAAGGQGQDLASRARGVEGALNQVARRVGDRARLVDAVAPDGPLAAAVEAVDTLVPAAARLVALELVAPGRGAVAGLQRSAGGVPKEPVPVAVVDAGGMAGDRQRERRHHGRPSQALCLWSAELVDALAAEGHPVQAGATGENVTVAGVDWGGLRPGARLVLGDGPGAPVVELTMWTEPCSTIARCFTDRAFRRIDHDRRPGWSRAYAAVVRPGTVAVGDPVTVLP